MKKDKVVPAVHKEEVAVPVAHKEVEAHNTVKDPHHDDHTKQSDPAHPSSRSLVPVAPSCMMDTNTSQCGPLTSGFPKDKQRQSRRMRRADLQSLPQPQ